MDHGDDRDVESHHGTDLRGVVAGGVDDVLADDAALLGDDFHRPSGSASMSVTRLFRMTCAPNWRAPFARALVAPVGSAQPSFGVHSAVWTSSMFSMSGLSSRTVSADDLVLDAEPIQLGADLTVPEHVLVGDCELQAPQPCQPADNPVSSSIAG